MAGKVLTTYWEGGYRCRIPVRGFEIIADEPLDEGGTDTGPAPTDLLLAALGSCFAMAIYHAAKKRNVQLTDLQVRTTGTYEGLRYSDIKVEIISNHDPDELELFVERAKTWCYVSNTLRGDVNLEYRIARAAG
ncbi:MAG TPA: OsmC family protein [Actinomycetota bacterium]|nr:OsmC family protein [Actinomycetota bacterium]